MYNRTYHDLYANAELYYLVFIVLRFFFVSDIHNQIINYRKDVFYVRITFLFDLQQNASFINYLYNIFRDYIICTNRCSDKKNI
jgi:hypothetical protein